MATISEKKTTVPELRKAGKTVFYMHINSIVLLRNDFIEELEETELSFNEFKEKFKQSGCLYAYYVISHTKSEIEDKIITLYNSYELRRIKKIDRK